MKIGKRTELAKESWPAPISEVHYQCEPEQYPPLLIATLDNRPTRIILSFGKYYTAEDLEELRLEATGNDWDCIAIPLPRIKDKESITPDMLRNSVQGCVEEKKLDQERQGRPLGAASPGCRRHPSAQNLHLIWNYI